jgi:hypothetical protein
MTPYETYVTFEGWRKKETEVWRKFRWLAFVIAKAGGSKINSPEDLMKLDGDEPAMTLEEKRAILARIPEQIVRKKKATA